ncbi:MAG: LPP20 family lipoprotein, partial [Nitrospirae bacterium]|nr:LPP20 family lipoprotein [Nitrospirota bacterium]
MRQTGALLIALTVVLAGSLVGCARTGHGPVPSWIEGASREYPSDQYLIGVGQADTQAVAAERAYAAVAKIFKAEVNARSRDWESFLLFENRGQANTERRLTLDQLTRVSTDKVLENVKILDAWFNPRTGQHHA